MATESVVIKNAGYSNRYIAKEIWGDSNKEYTIRRFLKKYQILLFHQIMIYIMNILNLIILLKLFIMI